LTVNLGYLPQDVVDLSLLSLIEDEGLCDFEKTHLKALKSTSKSAVQSKIYKMKASDGSLVSLISYWSVYVNPWTKLAEFIAGRHEIHLSVDDDLSSLQNLNFRRINLQEYKDVMSQRKILSEKACRVQQRLRKIHMELWSFQTCQLNYNGNFQYANSTPTNGGSSRRSTGSSSTFSKKLKSMDDDRNGGSVVTSPRHQQLHLPLLSCHMSTLFERMVEHEYFMATAPSLHSSNEEFFWKRFSPDIRHSATMSDSATTPPKCGYPVHCEVFSASPPDSFGSGPSYHEIARLENVNRLLISQEVDHSSDDSSNTLSKVSKMVDVQSIERPIETSTRRCRKISTASFKVADQRDENSSTNRNLHHRRRNDGHQNRSHSSASASDLTSANLHKFTKEQEKRHKADWKNGQRRRSMEIPTIFPHFDKKCESMIAEYSSKFNSFAIINETIDRKIDKQMIADLKPNFSSTLFNPLTMNDQDDLLPKCSSADLIGLANRPYYTTSSTFGTKFTVSSDAEFANNNEQNHAFNPLKRKREEEFVVSQVDEKKPINLCINKVTDSPSSCSTSYLSVIQCGVDCDAEHHLHDRIDHHFVPDKTALLSRDHHWRNTSSSNRLPIERKASDLLPRVSFFAPNQSTLQPLTTENSAFGRFTTSSNAIADSRNSGMNSEIISSIREATESSLMLNER
uniref:Uncharacterized protein n=1 Tax=Romanomermis culicivorax TaxID=13658 RepID=A0A915KHR1_ROMCU